MKMIYNKKAFTLIELLMVIAIIGILAGILIPTVGAVRKQANIAASKVQLSNYVTAIQMFKGEYGFYPFADGADVNFQLNSGTNNDLFIRTLSGRLVDGSGPDNDPTEGNRRRIGFLSFSESEFLEGTTTIADRFNNTNIVIVIDGDGDGRVTPTGFAEVKSPLTAYLGEDPADSGNPTYQLFDQ
jgi:prepilin-type N-terminal cleavage/methylation domain-containing protein